MRGCFLPPRVIRTFLGVHWDNLGASHLIRAESGVDSEAVKPLLKEAPVCLVQWCESKYCILADRGERGAGRVVVKVLGFVV